MGFRVVLSTRPTIKMSDLLSIFSLWHNVSSCVSRRSELVERAAYSEALAGSDASVTCYRRTENIFVAAIVVAEHEFVQIQRQICSAHAVVRADNPALE